MTRNTVYNDSWFDQLAINHLSQSVQAATGLRNKKSGYESLVQAATDASQKFKLTHQRELVLEALDKAIPRPILDLIKMVMPQSKFTREYFAAFTTLFFVWLIGPCEVCGYSCTRECGRHAHHVNRGPSQLTTEDTKLHVDP